MRCPRPRAATPTLQSVLATWTTSLKTTSAWGPRCRPTWEAVVAARRPARWRCRRPALTAWAGVGATAVTHSASGARAAAAAQSAPHRASCSRECQGARHGLGSGAMGAGRGCEAWTVGVCVDRCAARAQDVLVSGAVLGQFKEGGAGFPAFGADGRGQASLHAFSPLPTD